MFRRHEAGPRHPFHVFVVMELMHERGCRERSATACIFEVTAHCLGVLIGWVQLVGIPARAPEVVSQECWQGLRGFHHTALIAEYNIIREEFLGNNSTHFWAHTCFDEEVSNKRISSRQVHLPDVLV
ncbi:uncharacterized protein LY89DRAFT_138008 [Mollisia scopiformis]|uniref:Uncharacterized protein n=1 Tax=Mollisia scopiformis TaxID=149040 RepID=A0A194X2J0_MOLSC|nr:uncharacterized protein LY89DRAFT_138008 [Mollisia scopiformis]KUJ14398.1 hypothetical protein LY89DRAFT_138008 [Mollisia scopiformis]